MGTIHGIAGVSEAVDRIRYYPFDLRFSQKYGVSIISPRALSTESPSLIVPILAKAVEMSSVVSAISVRP